MPTYVTKIRPLQTAVLAVLAAMLAGCFHPSAPAVPPSQTVSGMTITLLAVLPAHTGDNTFVVTLKDVASGAPIGNANLTATPEMMSPRLPGTPTSGRAQGNGMYNVPIRLAVATRYDIVLHVERTGHLAAAASFPVEAAQ